MAINPNNKKSEFNWRKLFWLGVLVAVLAYGFGEPYLENWLGIDLPSIRDSGNQVAESKSDSDVQIIENRSSVDPAISSRQDSGGGTATLEKPKSRPSENKTSQSNGRVSRESNPDKPYLTPTGKKNRLRSPAGLVYGESKGEHRVDHVMRHAVDDKNRPVHSVFVGSKREILELIDEAYDLVKSKSPRVITEEDDRLDFRVEHKIDMKRKIGYLGGQRGRRENYPPRSKLTLVLDNGKFVVTAYPDR